MIREITASETAIERRKRNDNDNESEFTHRARRSPYPSAMRQGSGLQTAAVSSRLACIPAKDKHPLLAHWSIQSTTYGHPMIHKQVTVILQQLLGDAAARTCNPSYALHYKQAAQGTKRTRHCTCISYTHAMTTNTKGSCFDDSLSPV
jgi:hypothetical protein